MTIRYSNITQNILVSRYFICTNTSDARATDKSTSAEKLRRCESRSTIVEKKKKNFLHWAVLNKNTKFSKGEYKYN